jgi:hypothetical protein
MAESKVWGIRRYVTLLTVLAVHGAFFAALTVLSIPRRSPLVIPQSVELLLLPPPRVLPVASRNFPSRRVRGVPPIVPPPPVLDFTALITPGSATDMPSSAADGNGRGVNWAAEARRALMAFEIRNHQPKSEIATSGSAVEDHWWPRSSHRAGDQFKTAGGDWIVWINSNCYQIAQSASNAAALSAPPPPTICRNDSANSPGDGRD